MIAANKAIFSLLDEFCTSRDSELRNAGKSRWIDTEPSDRGVLKDASVSASTSFAPSKRISRLDYNGQALFCTVGFEAPQLPELTMLELNGALLTLVLFELQPRPTATVSQVRNIIEVSDKETDSKYGGHDFHAVESLFPTIAIQSARDLDEDETWRIFFLICLKDCRESHPWMNAALVETLQSLCGLGLINVPFETLCRSIFDSDPSALFLALYRCMEAIYAYSSAMKLKAGLKLPNSWTEIAAVLEDELNWHPREEGSLTELMNHALNIDIESIFRSLSESIPPKGARPPATAQRIYRLRNSLVHYRPSNKKLDFDAINWNDLCRAMANIICDMYAGAFA